ncbi:BnaA08g27560D [Brassica napus]|uniref:(rape) hypothetical protein n=1 Tax=Brassica napus TaxID=3708 RepID=A0A078FRJ2_BRANA|nr:unnamed protein product [Brassica napus]CDY15472.1 BnaA08g27560D [Brassica napus]
MNRLEHFVDENDNLIKKLPDQLHHNVPFKRRLPSSLQLLAEGLLEIREEYEEEEEDYATVLQPGVKKEASGVNPGGEGEAGEGEVEDDEFARIMSKLNELEMQEELEGEDGDDYISEEQDSSVESIEESELLGVVNGIGDKTNHNKIDYEKSAAKQESSISVLEKPRVKEKAIQVLPERYPHKHADDLLKAFTGSIVEHARNLETNTHCLMQQPSGSQPSKPVSIFKAQRR